MFQPGPSRFPQLPGSADTHHGYGRPPVAVSDPARLVFVTRGVDILGHSRNAMAREIHSHAGDLDQAACKAARRDLASGRRHLARSGVLPWCAWRDGQLPERWWHDEAFKTAIAVWRERAVRHPVTPPEHPIRQAVRQLTPSRADLEAAIYETPLPRVVLERRLAEIERHPWQPPADDRLS